MSVFNLFFCCGATEKSIFIHKFVKVIIGLHCCFLLGNVLLALLLSNFASSNPFILLDIFFNLFILGWSFYFVCKIRKKGRKFDYEQSKLKSFCLTLLAFFGIKIAASIGFVIYYIVQIELINSYFSYHQNKHVMFEE